MSTNRIGVVAVLCSAAAMLAACGGSSAGGTGTHAARPTPVESAADVGTAPATQGHPAQASSASSKRPKPKASGGTQLSGEVGPTPAAGSHVLKASAYTDNERATPTGKPFNPCTLVSAAEAQSITGGAVAGSTEAPLGPTCIYRLSGTRSVTLAVESLRFSQVTHQMSGRSALTIRGRQAYCGKLGTQMLFVPLAGGRVLNVTAPCSLAQRFATLALSHFSA